VLQQAFQEGEDAYLGLQLLLHGVGLVLQVLDLLRDTLHHIKERREALVRIDHVREGFLSCRSPGQGNVRATTQTPTPHHHLHLEHLLLDDLQLKPPHWVHRVAAKMALVLSSSCCLPLEISGRCVQQLTVTSSSPSSLPAVASPPAGARPQPLACALCVLSSSSLSTPLPGEVPFVSSPGPSCCRSGFASPLDFWKRKSPTCWTNKRAREGSVLDLLSSLHDRVFDSWLLRSLGGLPPPVARSTSVSNAWGECFWSKPDHWVPQSVRTEKSPLLVFGLSCALA
jgi:hypothetical protein